MAYGDDFFVVLQEISRLWGQSMQYSIAVCSQAWK